MMNNVDLFTIDFKWVGAATWVLSIDEMKIACDPVLCPKGTVQTHAPGFNSTRLTEPVYDGEDFENVDLWLISHEHEDHLDGHGLAQIRPEAHIVSNKKSEKVLGTIQPKNHMAARPGQILTYRMKGLSIDVNVMPAVHGSNFLSALLLGGGNGYWLKIRKETAELDIYVTGDTVSHPKVLAALNGRKADILIPNIGAPFQNVFGGPFTFTVKDLQPVIDTVRPDIILPVHFGTFSHFQESHQAIRSWGDERVKIFKEGDTFQNQNR